ncbi:metallophosphoesterase family protein [Bacillus cihuensis]|uniref:metallophosphoesterase family protein n=1 Tax=Bacillus cihuensis TaxID=1208599 RepID=UPI0003F89605|nr:metallophosphoesterase [Bacillus cihuensis]
MRILAFADTRTSLQLPDENPDLVLLLGDIPSIMVSRIDRKYNCKKFGVLGNHCHPEVFAGTNVQDIHNIIVTHCGLTLAGFEGSPKYKDRPFGHHSEEEAELFIATVGNKHIDILITHSNPAYGDMELDYAHRGYQAFSQLILKEQISHFFHGHLHDPFNKKIGKTTIHSVYPYLSLEI